MATMKSQFKRKSSLVSALQKMDNGRYKDCVEVYEEKQLLHGYDESGANARKSEIIIRRKNIPGSWNDMGFSLQADGTYSIECSDTAQSWLDKLTQTYSTEVIREVSEEQGFNFETREENGEIFVTCERSY
jgi:hypothetical protein